MTFAVIKKHVDALDPQDLLASGAPRDEYDIESEMLAELLSPEQSPEDMAQIIAELFAKQFATEETPDKYMDMARQLRAEQTKA